MNLSASLIASTRNFHVFAQCPKATEAFLSINTLIEQIAGCPININNNIMICGLLGCYINDKKPRRLANWVLNVTRWAIWINFLKVKNGDPGINLPNFIKNFIRCRLEQELISKQNLSFFSTNKVLLRWEGNQFTVNNEMLDTLDGL